MLNETSLDTVCASLAYAMGVEAPAHAAPANEELVRYIDQALGGKKVDRIFMYNPDAIGQWIMDKYPMLVREVDAFADITLPLRSVMPSVTPVCFGTMYTGAQPEIHGIQAYAKPVIRIDTLFDAMLRAGKKCAIVSNPKCSLNCIFREREMDYYEGDDAAGVNAIASRLILEDKYDLLVVYNGNYDFRQHRAGPEGMESLAELRHNSIAFQTFLQMLQENWKHHNTLVGFAMDHGCHRIPPMDKNGTIYLGTHGTDLPEDLNIRHSYKILPRKIISSHVKNVPCGQGVDPVKGVIFDIQRFSVHDGPGIRTTVFMKGCPLRCRWCHNPEGLSRELQLQYIKSACIGCGRCGKRDSLEDAANCPAMALKVCGRSITSDEVLEEVLRDRMFYGASGGITFSGGECLLQADFVAEVLHKAKELGLHCAIDTSGCVSWEAFEKTLPFCDLYLYDVKCMDPVLHREQTGQENTRILENLQQLATRGKEIWIRVPVIPGFNNTPEEMKAIAEYVAKLPGITQVTLMPYHTLGASKYETLGIEQPFDISLRISEAEMDCFRKIFTDNNLLLT